MSERGEVRLRRRDDGALELRVNGVFVMDDRETSSERALAARALGVGARDILIGGLGLGFTARALLAAEQVERLVVAEIHGEIVEWMRAGSIPGADLLDDPRLDLRIGDVRDVIDDLEPAGLDAILLDVDNGPDFLVYAANAEVYESAFLGVCAARLRADGCIALWSQADSEPLRIALSEHFAEVDAERFPVTLQDREESYWTVRGHRPFPSR